MDNTKRRERRIRIAEAVRKGMSVAKIARRYKLSIGTVRLACREHGVTPVQQAHLIVSTYDIIAALLNTNDSFASIATRYKRQTSYIKEIAMRCIASDIKIQKRL